MDNKYKYGLSRLGIAPITVTDGVYTYGSIIMVPGAKTISGVPRGDIAAFEADNRDYVVIDKNEGYDIDLEIVDLQDAVAELILKQVDDAKGVAAEYTGVQYPQFALLGQIQGDAYNRRFTYMDCVLMARPEIVAKSSKAREPDTTKLKISSRPRDQ